MLQNKTQNIAKNQCELTASLSYYKQLVHYLVIIYIHRRKKKTLYQTFITEENLKASSKYAVIYHLFTTHKLFFKQVNANNNAVELLVIGPHRDSVCKHALFQCSP